MGTWVIVIVVVAAVGLALILFAPWGRVPPEDQLPEEAETRILLGEPPEKVAAAMQPGDDDRRAPDDEPPVAS